MQNNIIVSTYILKPGKSKKKKDTLNITRSIETFHTENNFSFTYITSLKNEYTESLEELKEEGFFCGNEKDTANILFQKKNISVLTCTPQTVAFATFCRASTRLNTPLKRMLSSPLNVVGRRTIASFNMVWKPVTSIWNF